MFAQCARLLAVLLLAAAGPKMQDAQAGKLVVEPYKLRTFDGSVRDAELGRLWVRENRQGPSVRLIQVAFVRLRTTAPRPGPPIVFLSGGPGVPGTVMGQVPVYFALFERLLQTSDVILLDQRGTGLSSPNLQCSADVPIAADAFADETGALAALMDSVRACAERARADGVDLAAYNTNASAEDLDDLRRAIGAPRVSLLGFSYGTELALAAIRLHGDTIHRVVFAAMRGPDHTMKLPGTLDRHLRTIARLAAAGAGIAGAQPDMIGALREALAALAKRPATVSVRDRKIGKSVDLQVGPIGLQAVIQREMNDARALPRLPALIAFVRRGDYSLLTPHVEQLYDSFRTGISSMTVAVDCASGASAERRARAEREAEGALLDGAMNMQLRPEVCALVGNPDLGAAFRAPVTSRVPALFISGTLDGGAPSYQAEEVRRRFSDSAHLIVENAGHETLPAREVQAIVDDFFRGRVVKTRVSLPAIQFMPIETRSR